MSDLDAAVEQLRVELDRAHGHEEHGAIKRAMFSVDPIRTVLDALAEAQVSARIMRYQRNDARRIADGHRTRADAAEKEMHARELHHFEQEEENAKLEAHADRMREERDAAEAKLARIAEYLNEWESNAFAQPWMVRRSIRRILNEEGTETNGSQG